MIERPYITKLKELRKLKSYSSTAASAEDQKRLLSKEEFVRVNIDFSVVLVKSDEWLLRPEEVTAEWKRDVLNRRYL
jgi:hypothetical protein